MKSMVFAVAILTLLAVGPAQAQSSGISTFAVGGSVHNLGWVSKGTEIQVTVATALLTSASLVSCPIRATIILMESNSGKRLQKLSKKQNAATSTTTMSKTKYNGDALYILQAQNASDICISIQEVAVNTFNAVQDSDTQDLSMQGMPSDDSIVDVWTGDEVPDQSIPLQRNDLPQQLLDYLDNAPY
jgi:hypothetical protein